MFWIPNICFYFNISTYVLTVKLPSSGINTSKIDGVIPIHQEYYGLLSCSFHKGPSVNKVHNFECEKIPMYFSNFIIYILLGLGL